MIRFQSMPDEQLEVINTRFNEQLQQQIDGTLPKGYTYQLGTPSAILQSAGVPNLPIELQASRLSDKSMQENHPFDLSEVKDLPKAVQDPLAVFRSATRLGYYVIMTEIEHDGNNYVVALEANKKTKNININDIRSIYPKYSKQVANWIDEGLLEYTDKKRMSAWVSKQQSNSAEVRSLYRHASKIVNGFENPKFHTTKNHFTPVKEQKFNRIIDQLRKTGLAKDIITDPVLYQQKLEEVISDNTDIGQMRTNAGDIYGFVTPDGTVWLDTARMNANTPIHELGHLWNSFIKENNPELWAKGAELVKESEYWQRVNDNPSYRDLSDEAKVDEALAMAYGDKGEAIVNRNLKQRFVDWVKDVWEWIGDKLGIRNLTPEQIQSLTLEQFVDGAVADMLSGKKIKEGEGVENNNENSKFVKNDSDNGFEQNGSTEARLDNRRTMGGSAIGGTLASPEKRNGISRTVASANLGGNTSDVFEAEELEELESRGINPYWDANLFKKELKEQAQKNGVWLESDYLDDKRLTHDHRAQGTSENDIYENPDGKTITKLNNLSYVKGVEHSRNLGAFIDRLKSHNELFSNAAYTIEGFMDNKTGVPSLVLNQRVIDAERNATQEEIDNYLTEAGFKKDGARDWSNGHEVWSNGAYELFDARPANVLMGKDGNLYFIDTIPHSVAYLNENRDKNIVEDNKNSKFAEDDTTRQQQSEIPFGSSEEELRGSDGNTPRGEEASVYLRGRVEAARAKQQGQLAEREIKDVERRAALDYAKENNLWIDDIYDLGIPFPGGGNENTLVYDADNRIIYKSNNLLNANDSISRLLDQIQIHNELFPETKYELIGFTGIDNGQKSTPYIEVVLSQEYISDAKQASYEDIEKYMRDKGFEKINNSSFTNGVYTVSDLHPRNVLLDKNGYVNVIDNIIRRDSVDNAVRFQSVNDVERIGELEELNKTLNKKHNKLLEGWQNAIRPVEKWMEYLRKKGMKIEDHDDYVMQYSSIVKKTEARGEVFRGSYLRPLLESIADIQKKGKVSYRDVISYMMLKHGPERNEWMRQNAINRYKLDNPEATKKQIGRFTNKLSDKDYAGVKAIEKEVGMSAEEYTSSFEKKVDKNLIDVLWTNTRKATSFRIEEEYRAGLISKAQRDEILSMYKYYVPLKGHDADTMEDVYDYGRKSNIFFTPRNVKAEGRISRAEDPIAYIALDAQSAIHASMQNVHLQQIKRIASKVEKQAKNKEEKPHVTVSKTWYKKIGEKDGVPIWSIADEATYPTDGSLSNEQAQTEYQKNIEDYDKYMEELAKKGEAFRSGDKKLDVGMFIKPAQARQHEVHVWQNGVMHTIRFNTNPAIPRAINKANLIHAERYGTFANKALGVFGSTTRFMSAMFTTFRPAFAFYSNPLRDFGYTFNRLLVKEGWDYGKKALANYLVAFAMIPAYLSGRVSLNNKLMGKYMVHYADFISNGGPTGLSDLVELKGVQKQIQRELKIAQQGKIKGMPTLVKRYAISAFKNLSEWPENVSRFAVYLTSIESGRSIPRAIHDAKNVTVDFNKKGSGAYGNSEARLLLAFINAGVQGVSNLADTAKSNPLGVAISMAGYAVWPAVVMPALNSFLANMTGDDDDEKWKNEYAKLSDYTRNNNLCFYTGSGFVTVPLNQEYRMFNGVGSNYFLFKEGKKNAKDIAFDLLKGVADLVAYNPASSAMEGSIADAGPTVIAPWGQVQGNSTFYGSPIYNKWAKEALPAYRQVRRNKKGESYTPESLVEFYGWLNQITGGDDTFPGWIRYAKIGKHDFSNPDIVNHYLSGYVPAFYNPVIRQLDNFRSDESLGDKMKNFFVPGALYKSSDDLPNLDRYTMEKYYDISRQIDESKTRLNDIMKNSSGLTDQIEKINKHPEIALKSSFSEYLNKIKGYEQELKNLSPEEQDKYELLIGDMKVKFIELYDNAIKSAGN